MVIQHIYIYDTRFSAHDRFWNNQHRLRS